MCGDGACSGCASGHCSPFAYVCASIRLALRKTGTWGLRRGWVLGVCFYFFFWLKLYLLIYFGCQRCDYLRICAA